MANKLTYYYDKRTDELNLTFGNGQGAVGFELKNEIFLQLHPKTHEVVGITVPFFSTRLKAREQHKASVLLRGALFASRTLATPA